MNKAGRRSIALVWAMAAVFAVAPGVSMAFASPAGAFSRILIHVHADDEPGHVHHGHHHHDHGHHDHGDHHLEDDGTGTGSGNDQGQPRAHVHYDAGCPSVVIPVQLGCTLQHRLGDRVTMLRVDPMQGAPPDSALRPPIPASVL